MAIPEAGPGGAICFHQGSAQLQASGGDTYQWTPAAGLSNPAIANPVATPDVSTTYKVLVGVTGCAKKRSDTTRVLVRALPAIALTNDTLICSIDTLKLTASGTGSFAWSPNYSISSLTSPTPLVSPDVPTKYYTTLTDGFGCINRDSVFVDVKLYVTINAGKDTTICRKDGFFLNTTSDALSYKWTPATYLSSDTAKRPFATPLDPVITYHVIGNIGKCQSSSAVTIKTIPYPQAYAGRDTALCPGFSAILHASGGSSYRWSPATFLTATNIPNPIVVKPVSDTRYIVTVSDMLGCPKSVNDTVWVRVYPKVIADAGPSDTSVVIGQSLQLHGSGGEIYVWSPPRWLSDPTIANPVALPEDDIQYKLLVKSLPGYCEGRDSIKVKVYLVPPSLYVPTAFSPNNDGNNEILRPILLGMRSITYFRVYNRWGELVFSTTEKDKGWDGTFKGMPQDPATYVWVAEGVTYKGVTIHKKGYAVLIR